MTPLEGFLNKHASQIQCGVVSVHPLLLPIRHEQNHTSQLALKNNNYDPANNVFTDGKQVCRNC